jgi:hypothetical protein
MVGGISRTRVSGLRRWEPCERAGHRLHQRQSGAEHDDRHLQQLHRVQHLSGVVRRRIERDGSMDGGVFQDPHQSNRPQKQLSLPACQPISHVHQLLRPQENGLPPGGSATINLPFYSPLVANMIRRRRSRPNSSIGGKAAASTSSGARRPARCRQRSFRLTGPTTTTRTGA